jgi:hypothetical protein
MPGTFLFVLLLTLFPMFAIGKDPPGSCALAYRMQRAELPRDIAVKTDKLTSEATTIAMNWWTARLSTPARPVTWHVVDSLDECMIYIRYGGANMMFRVSLAGYTHMPGYSPYDGIATVKFGKAWVVAHEIGHLIGCQHGVGVMRAAYIPEDNRLWIDERALHYALLVRLKVSGFASATPGT